MHMWIWIAVGTVAVVYLFVTIFMIEAIEDKEREAERPHQRKLARRREPKNGTK